MKNRKSVLLLLALLSSFAVLGQDAFSLKFGLSKAKVIGDFAEAGGGNISPSDSPILGFAYTSRTERGLFMRTEFLFSEKGFISACRKSALNYREL